MKHYIIPISQPIQGATIFCLTKNISLGAIYSSLKNKKIGFKKKEAMLNLPQFDGKV